MNRRRISILWAPSLDRIIFARVVHIEAQRGEYQEVDKAIPCPSGTFETTVEFLHKIGRESSGYAPTAALTIRTERGQGLHTEWFAVTLAEEEGIQPNQQEWIEAGEGNNRLSRWDYSRPRPFEHAERMSVSWTGNGVVAATLAGMEHHEYRLAKAPAELSMKVSGAAVDFRDPQLICDPPNPIEAPPPG